MRPPACATFLPPRRRPPHDPGRVVLRVLPDAVGDPGAPELPEAVAAPLRALTERAGLQALTPLLGPGRAAVQRPDLEPADRGRLALQASVRSPLAPGLAGLVVASVAHLDAEALAAVAQAPAFAFAEPLPVRYLAQEPPEQADPLRNLQWGLRAVNWFEAQRPDAGEVLVGVIDTGIDATHPDLVALELAYDHPGTGAADLLGHGSHVSGIIAAITNNAVGISGLAHTDVAMWKVFPDAPWLEGDFFVDGERYLQALGDAVRVAPAALNLSLGGPETSMAERLIFGELVSAGVTVVAAMGNEFQEGNPVSYPAAHEDVVAVGAVGADRRRAAFSNTGPHIALVAPGVDVLSTVPVEASAWREETGYASWSGTSMAAPHVAGAVALLAARHPDWSASERAEHLQSTCAQVAGMEGEAWTEAYGAGLLDLARALE